MKEEKNISKQEEHHFLVKMSLSTFSDEDGFNYINPSLGNIERLIREGLRGYINTKDLKINKLEVIPSQPV